MDANVLESAEHLAQEIARKASTVEELNSVMRALMKSALEKMLGTELNAHLSEEKAAASAATINDGAVAPTKRRNRRNGTLTEIGAG